MAESRTNAPAEQAQQRSREERGQQTSQRNDRELPARRQQRGEQGRGALGDMFGGSPFQLMRRMSEEMDRVFDRVFDDFGSGRSVMPRSLFGGGSLFGRETVWAPRAELFQKDDQFIVRAELPGLNRDDIDVTISDDQITIQGERRDEREREDEGLYVSERSYGRFYRTIPLPEGVIADSAKASFKDGVLEIRLQAPPHEVSRGRRVEITGESEESTRGKQEGQGSGR
jgi:HSP20 family protein